MSAGAFRISFPLSSSLYSPEDDGNISTFFVKSAIPEEDTVWKRVRLLNGSASFWSLLRSNHEIEFSFVNSFAVVSTSTTVLRPEVHM